MRERSGDAPAASGAQDRPVHVGGMLSVDGFAWRRLRGGRRRFASNGGSSFRMAREKRRDWSLRVRLVPFISVSDQE